MHKKSCVLIALLLLFLTVSTAEGQSSPKRTSTGFYWPTGTDSLGNYAGWLYDGCPWSQHPYGTYDSNLYHIGWDIQANVGDPVYAVADGEVIGISSGPFSGWPYNATDVKSKDNIGVLVKHQLADGTDFIAVYGHIIANVNQHDHVTAGKPFGKIGPYGEQSHLHFGIRPGTSTDGDLGRMTCPQQKPQNGIDGVPTNGFVDPIAWIKTKSPLGGNPAPALARAWRTQPDTSTGFLAWWWTFGICDTTRRIKAYVDDDLIIYTSSQDGPNPSHSQTKWLWPSDHKYKVEVFDYPNTPAVELSWAFAPLGQLQPVPPACSSEPVPPTPTNIPIIASTPEQPVKLFFDDLARDDLDTAINQCFAPQHRLLVKPLLDTYQSAKKDQGITLKFANLNYKIVSNDGQKGLVKVTGSATLRDKNGKQYQYSFDIDVPVFTFLNTWYIDLDIQRLQQLLDQMSR